MHVFYKKTKISVNNKLQFNFNMITVSDLPMPCDLEGSSLYIQLCWGGSVASGSGFLSGYPATSPNSASQGKTSF